ncbi:MAG: hypothetical protein H0Z38_01600 [Firmicutes bacterium]|nr:hypothetical protein [Bacillota bacterium]
MDLEKRLSRLKGEILAIKRNLDVQGDPEVPAAAADSGAVTVSYKLDQLISEYLRLKEKIDSLKEQGRL